MCTIVFDVKGINVLSPENLLVSTGSQNMYEGCNFNGGNYLFTNDTK